MVKGHILAVSALVALLVAPLLASSPAAARAPEAVFNAPFDVKREITGFDLDAQGRYAAVVVDIDASALTTPLGQPIPNENYDVWLFDVTNSGNGLQYKERHRNEVRVGAAPTTQVVDFAADTGKSATDPGLFFVGGPGVVVSGWDTSGPTSNFDKTISGTTGSTHVVAASSNGKLAAFGTGNTVTRLLVLEGGEASSAGAYKWEWNVTDTTGSTTKATVVKWARTTNLLVVGHEKGVAFIADGTKKPGASDIKGYRTEGKVTSIDMSLDGKYVVVGTDSGSGTGYVYYFHAGLDPDRSSPFNRNFASPVRAVAITNDGRYFAAGTGAGDVHFLERAPEGQGTAQLREDPKNPPATKFEFKTKGIVSLDYDDDGDTLVAATETDIAGFHVSRHAPVWRLTATEAGLDVPLKGAKVSDDGERVLLAGKTKVTALRSVLAATATVPGGLARTAVPGDVVRYDLTVKNTGSAPDTYNVRVTPPAGGWSYDPLPALTLLPDEERTVKVNVTSPTGTAPGSSTAKVIVESQGRLASARYNRQGTIATFDLNITLARVSNVRLEAGETDITVNQDQDTNFVFNVKNLGNADADVNLTVTQDPSRAPSWRIRFDPARVAVRPGETKPVTAIITAPADAADGDSNVITVRANVGTTYHVDLVVTARVNPVFKMELTANTTSVTVPAERPATVTLTLKNLGNSADTANLTAVVNPESARLDWRASLDYKAVEVAKGGTRNVQLTLRATKDTAEPASVTVTMATAAGGERQSVTIEMERAAVEEEDKGLFGLPGPSAAATLAVAAALAVAVVRRKR